jgi:hypothetical protein
VSPSPRSAIGAIGKPADAQLILPPRCWDWRFSVAFWWTYFGSAATTAQ